MGGEIGKSLAAVALLATVFIAVVQTTDWQAETVPQEDLHLIAEALFDTYVVPLLVLGVLLTGALLGALYMGYRTDDDPEEEDAA